MVRRHSSIRMAALVGFAGLNLLDVLTTWIGLQMGMIEANALAAAVMRAEGQGGMFLFKLVAALLVMNLVVQLSPRFARIWYAIYAGSGVLALVVLLNSVQIILF